MPIERAARRSCVHRAAREKHQKDYRASVSKSRRTNPGATTREGDSKSSATPSRKTRWSARWLLPRTAGLPGREPPLRDGDDRLQARRQGVRHCRQEALRLMRAVQERHPQGSAGEVKVPAYAIAVLEGISRTAIAHLTCNLVQCDRLSLQPLFVRFQPAQCTRRGAQSAIAVEKTLDGMEDA